MSAYNPATARATGSGHARAIWILLLGLGVVMALVWVLSGTPDRCEQLGYAMDESGECVTINNQRGTR